MNAKSTSTQIAPRETPGLPSPEILETVLLAGDLSKLTPAERVSFYRSTCDSLGLNPLTKPFAYLVLNGKLTLYALKDATEQLRKLHGVSITEVTSTRLGDVFVVTAKAQDRTGRTDAATGAVAIGTLRGEALANGLMKAETKAKRRATLSICGLGVLDDSELDTLPQAQPLDCDPVTGELHELPAAATPRAARDKKISKAQQARFWMLVRATGWTDEQVRALLFTKYGLHKTADIRVSVYNQVCADIQAGPPAPSSAEVVDDDQPF